MSTKHLKNAVRGTRVTPVTKRAPGRTDQITTSGGAGYAFEVDDFARLRRFLILGTEGGSYYANESKLTQENADVVIRCLKADGQHTVAQIVSVSAANRAPKNDQAIFALALATVPDYADDVTRAFAFNILPMVVRTGTHLFMFCDFVDGMRGWGQGLMKAVASWYEAKDADALAYQLVKYRQRHGWTHRDVLRSCHGTKDSPHAFIYDWLFGAPSEPANPLPYPEYVGSDEDVARKNGSGTMRAAKPHLNLNFKADDPRRLVGDQPDAILAYEHAQRAQSATEIVDVIDRYGNKLPHEAIPTQFKNDPLVWSALLDKGMPTGALIRNLANLTRYGVIAPFSGETQTVVKQLTNPDAIVGARIHPLNVLRALYTYKMGHPPVRVDGYGYSSFLSDHTWNPVVDIIDALDEAFYLAFGSVEAHGTRRMIALDISGSMGWSNIDRIDGFTARDASAAMCMTSLRTGDPTMTVGFSHELVALPLSAKQRLDDAVRTVSDLHFGATNISLPMEYARQAGLEVDVFEVYTDNEINTGYIHPFQSIREYRRESGIDARLVVVGMVANDISVADPNDAGMLDVVGFDTAAPQLISDFGAGRL